MGLDLFLRERRPGGRTLIGMVWRSAKAGAIAALLAGCSYPGIPAQSSPAEVAGTSSSVLSQTSSFSLVKAFRSYHPLGALLDVGGTLYGTANLGGYGIVYAMSSAGVMKTLHRFKGPPDDGAYPQGSLIDVNGTLYGTTGTGGKCDSGTVYSISITGVENVLHSLCHGDSNSYPVGGLTDVDGALYGVTHYTEIGTHNRGTFGEIFRVTTSGGFKIVHVFNGDVNRLRGAEPNAGLVDVHGTIYGTTQYGGWGCTIPQHAACGTIFAIDKNGKFALLYRFTGGSDGAFPGGGLTQIGGTLYGTTRSGGTGTDASCNDGCGTVYSFNTSGAEHVLYSFAGGNDGNGPNATLLALDGALYGATENGGGANVGTVFTVSATGSESVLHSFNVSQGSFPDGPVIDMGGMLYGATYRGGDRCLHGGARQREDGCGVVYALSP